MKSQQSGFTLVEIAIVLVIIGLLLGGILKGQELINSAKVKNLANDFRTIPTYIYAYQDKFKALARRRRRRGHRTSVPPVRLRRRRPPNTVANGVIDGCRCPRPLTDESFLFWQHVRLANLAPARPTRPHADYTPKNVDGGRLGIASITRGAVLHDPTAMTRHVPVCSRASSASSPSSSTSRWTTATPRPARCAPRLTAALATALGNDGDRRRDVYTVCMTF